MPLLPPPPFILPQPKGQGVVYRRSPSILPLSAEAFKQQDLHSLFGTVATLSWPLALPLFSRAKDVPELKFVKEQGLPANLLVVSSVCVCACPRVCACASWQRSAAD